jgi:thiol:disulfide interchange protein
MKMSPRARFPWLAALLALAPAPAVFAQFAGMGSSASPVRVRANLAVHEGRLVAGEPGAIGVILDIQRNWKVQAGAGSGDEVEPYIPTTIELTLPEGWSAGKVIWPEAKRFTLGEGEWMEELAGYEGRMLAAVPVKAPADAEPGLYPITARVGYQACDPIVCDLPTSTTTSAEIRLVSASAAGEAAPLDAAIAALFQQTLSRAGGEIVVPAEGGDAPGDGATAAPEGGSPSAAPASGAAGSTFFGLSVPRHDGLFGLALLALLSAVGGFILNLTPCVLPVIPIKVMTILQHANSPGRNLALGLWMAAGVVFFWVAIGLPVAFLSGVTDPSQLFGIWWVTFGIGMLIALMGIGIMGMFTIQLPQAVYAVNPKADTSWGSFAFGVMTAVLGLPCFGFVAGALLVGSATMPPSTIMVVFASLGVGMALPYLVLSAKPSLIERIPRTGPASELVKQVMGLLLLAAAAYFVGSGLVGLVNEAPYMARQLHWWAVALFAAMAGLWLIVRTFQITPGVGARLSLLVVGVLLGGIAVAYAADSTEKARSNWELREAAMAETGSYAPGLWNDYTPAAFERAREDGRIVVLDFTAEWCINCKLLKASVLNRDPVRAELANHDVVSFTVDLTSTQAPGWQFLRDLGQTGIPLLAIYAPEDETPWQSNAYTPQQVLEALGAARSRMVARR